MNRVFLYSLTLCFCFNIAYSVLLRLSVGYSIYADASELLSAAKADKERLSDEWKARRALL